MCPKRIKYKMKYNHVQAIKRFFGSAKLMIYAFLLRKLKKEQDLILMCQISIKYNVKYRPLRDIVEVQSYQTVIVSGH